MLHAVADGPVRLRPRDRLLPSDETSNRTVAAGADAKALDHRLDVGVGRDLVALSLVDGVEQLVHLRSETAKLAPMEHGQPFELVPAGGSRGDEGPSGVVGIDQTLDETMVCGAADELAGGVESDVEMVGDVGQ